MTGQHTTKKHQDHHKQMPNNDPLRNSNNYLEKAEEKPDVPQNALIGESYTMEN